MKIDKSHCTAKPTCNTLSPALDGHCKCQPMNSAFSLSLRTIQNTNEKLYEWFLIHHWIFVTILFSVRPSNYRGEHAQSSEEEWCLLTDSSYMIDRIDSMNTKRKTLVTGASSD